MATLPSSSLGSALSTYSLGSPSSGVATAGINVSAVNDNAGSSGAIAFEGPNKFFGQLQAVLNTGDDSSYMTLNLADSAGSSQFIFNFTLGLAGFYAPLGYFPGVGVGGNATQTTSKDTGVTLDKPTGQITMDGGALLPLTAVSFTLTNATIGAFDVVNVSIANGASANSYLVNVAATAAGSCVIQVYNCTAATTLSEEIVLNFAVLKGSNS